MESPGEPAPSFHQYPLLPCELKMKIIESWIFEVMERWRWDPECTSWLERDPSTGRPRIAKYATVDWLWKSVIEKCTFYGLSLPFDEIHTLDRMCVQDRMWAVRYIRLRLVLKRVNRQRTAWPFGATHATTNRADSTNHENDQSLNNTKSVEAVEDLIPILERLQESGLRVLYITVFSEGCIPQIQITAPELYTLPSLRFTQAMLAMTSKLERLTLMNVVDVPYLLKESGRVNGNALLNLTTWPNLRFFCLDGYTITEPSDARTFAAELYDAVTDALPHMPKINRLGITMRFPFYDNWHRKWDDVMVDMRILPRDDRFGPGLGNGRLFLHGPKPDPETMDKWKGVARRQWGCRLHHVRQ